MPSQDPVAPSRRLPTLESPESNPIVANLFEQIVARGARVLNVHRTLAHAPNVLVGWSTLSAALRHGSTLDRQLNELAIMRQSHVMGSEYEGYVHRNMSLHAGLSAEKIDAVKTWESSGLFNDLEKTVLRYTDAVIAGEGIPDELYEDITNKLPLPTVVELTASISYFIGTTYLLKALGVQVGADEAQLSPG